MKGIILIANLLLCGNIFSQTWQPIGIPQGSGITDLVYWSGGGAVFGNMLWATTGSVDWPTGQRGGVFYSSGNGVWNRIGGSAGYYVGRTLAVGQDENLYASLWRDPGTFPADALCRFVPQGALFEILYQAQSGDNIFSISVNNNPHTIFGGTRNGIIRSTDNGTSFGYSNTGIPDSAWVYDIAIDSSGILAIATSKGVFISTNNGDNWLATTGIPPEDTIVSLLFVNNVPTNLQEDKITRINQTDDALFCGTSNGKIYRGWGEDGYVIHTLIYLLAPDEEFKVLKGFYESIYGFARSMGNTRKSASKITNASGVYNSTDYGISWNQMNDGLPSNPPVSALALKLVSSTSAQLYAGLFGDTTNGAGVYKLDITVGVEETDNEMPSAYKLEQNYPNPFNPSTTIQFSVPEMSFVKLEIFNSLGEKVSTLVSEELNAGSYKFDWKAENLSSGIYYYTLTAGGFTQTRKLVLLK